MTMTDTGIIKLNQSKTTRKYFVSVKYAEDTREDFSPAYNADNISGYYAVSAETAEEAILKLHEKFSNENNLDWVRFEVYEEETVMTRRRIHIADRPRRYIEAIHAKNAATKAEKDARLEKLETKVTTRLNEYELRNTALATPKKRGLFGWVSR